MTHPQSAVEASPPVRRRRTRLSAVLKNTTEVAMKFIITLKYYLDPVDGLADKPSNQKLIAESLLGSEVQPMNWSINICYLYCHYRHVAGSKSEAILYGTRIGEDLISRLENTGVFNFSSDGRRPSTSELRSVEAVEDREGSDARILPEEIDGTQSLSPIQRRIIAAQLTGMSTTIMRAARSGGNCHWTIGQSLNAIRSMILGSLTPDELSVAKSGTPSINYENPKPGQGEYTVSSSQALCLYEQLCAIMSIEEIHEGVESDDQN